jgi:hypothetical protein
VAIKLVASPKSLGLVIVLGSGHDEALTGLEWLSIVRPEVRNKAVVKSFFDFKLNFFIFLWVRDL